MWIVNFHVGLSTWLIQYHQIATYQETARPVAGQHGGLTGDELAFTLINGGVGGSKILRPPFSAFEFQQQMGPRDASAIEFDGGQVVAEIRHGRIPSHKEGGRRRREIEAAHVGLEDDG